MDKMFVQSVIDQSIYTKWIDFDFMAGCDEVGRGPLAGPVVAATACVKINLIPKSCRQKFFDSLKDLGIGDSKSLSAKKRSAILTELRVDFKQILAGREINQYNIPKQPIILRGKFNYGVEIKYAVSEISAVEIDQINIFQASLKAMSESLKGCVAKNNRGILLVDGKFTPQTLPASVHAMPIIKGDQKSVLIALASILAKEYRDELMKIWDGVYPQYGLKKNAGYPTALHKAAILKYGILPIHRMSFRGVKTTAQEQSDGK